MGRRSQHQAPAATATVVAPPPPAGAVPPPGPLPPRTTPMPAPPPRPSFPPAPRPGELPGRHRSSSRSLNWTLVATLTAILLAAVAIVLWRNGALPTAAGVAGSENPAEESAADDGGASGDAPSSGDAQSSGDSGSLGEEGGTGDTGSLGDEDGTGDTGGLQLPGEGSLPLPPPPGTDTGTGTGSPGADGDLGLVVPISTPACDGSWIVVLASVTDPAQYASGVAAWLDQFPGSNYLLTEGGCSSLRQATPEGNRIYAVFAGPFTSTDQACASRGKYGDGAYVKVLDEQTPADQAVSCPD